MTKPGPALRVTSQRAMSSPFVTEATSAARCGFPPVPFNSVEETFSAVLRSTDCIRYQLWPHRSPLAGLFLFQPDDVDFGVRGVAFRL